MGQRRVPGYGDGHEPPHHDPPPSARRPAPEGAHRTDPPPDPRPAHDGPADTGSPEGRPADASSASSRSRGRAQRLRLPRLRAVWPPPALPPGPSDTDLELSYGGRLSVPRDKARSTEARRVRHLRRLRRSLRAAPWALLVAGVTFDSINPPWVGALPAFAVAPVLAAPFYGLRTVVVIALLSVVCLAVWHVEVGVITGSAAVSQLITCFLAGLVALLVNRAINRGRVLLATASEIAAAAQRAVLPEPAERLAGLDVAARYEAAQAGAFIGGDFYAAQDTPHGVRFLVGDVRGRGMEAVAAVAVLIGAFREAAEQENSLEAVAHRLDRALVRKGALRPRSDAIEEFATAVLAEVPHGHPTVRIVNRGHPPPLLLYPDGRLDELDETDCALPLGMADLGAWPDHAHGRTFPAGSTLLLFTDGLTEARDQHGAFYDPVARLRGRRLDDPHALLDFLTDDVRRHTQGGSTDDTALLAVHRPDTGHVAPAGR
mgnify:CR=1 FL=1